MTEVEDRISALPVEILSRILTLLTLKEAMATSILSKRWEILWASHPFLDFECFLDSGCLNFVSNETFVLRVYKILEKFNGSKIHTFRIVKAIPGDFGCHLDDWISFAFRNRVSELELDLVSPSSWNNYFLTVHVFADEFMKPKHYTTNSPSVAKHFEFLKDLCLSSVNLSDDVFDIMLLRCSSLERFRLMFNHGLVNVKNTAPHMMLKSLELINCSDLQKLELFAPNLVSFKYHGRERTLLIKNAHQLASLCLQTSFCLPDTYKSAVFPRGKNFIISQFSSYLCKLESFVVSVHFMKDMSDFTELCVFDNLKHLVLDVEDPTLIRLGYRVAASIIKGAPYLEQLELNLPAMSRACRKFQALDLLSMSPHQNLKVVKLYGFRGDVCTVEFLPYLVEFAVSLQKIDITACGALMVGGELQQLRHVNWNEDEAKFCKNCVLQLRQTLHANTQLVFHDE